MGSIDLKNIKLIVCDIDGTLMNGDKKLSKKLVTLVRRLKEKGVEFTFASGRLPYKIQPLSSQLKTRMPVISCNGAWVYQNGKTLFQKKFSANLVKDLVKKAILEGDTVLYSYDGKEYCLKETEESMYKRKVRGSYYPIRPISIAEWDTMELIKVNILSRKSNNFLANQLQPLKNNLFITCYGDKGLEIVAKGVDKKTGVECLTKINRVLPVEILAIGDNGNDLQLMKFAGYSVAVQNATREIKEVADYICPKEGEEGVIIFLEYYLKILEV